MNKIRHNIAGFIFAGLGIYFLYLDSSHMHHSHGANTSTLFGVGEMTWMWFTMAVVHFFLNDCQCKTCKGKD